MPPGRPKSGSRLANFLDEGETKVSMGETLDGRDYIDFMLEMDKIRSDPIYFIENILGFPGPADDGSPREMWPKQRQIIEEFYAHKYNPNLQPIKKMAFVAGQRSSKTTLCSTIMAYELVEVISWDNPAKHFGLMTGKSGKGSTIALTCLCPSRDQAKDGVFASMKSLLEGNDWFDLNFPDLIIGNERIEEPRKNVLAQVKAAKASTIAGYTNKVFIADEYDYFPDSDTQIDAEAVFTKLCNSTETFGRHGKIIAISSLKTQNGRMMNIFDQFKKQERSGIAKTFMYKTWEINPLVTQEYLLESCEGDRARFYRDFANEPQMSSGLQFPEGIKLDKTILNVLECDYEKLPMDIKQIPRVLSIDPAYKNDSFGISCAFKGTDTQTGEEVLVVDGVKKFEKMGDENATILPSDIKKFIVSTIQNLNVYAFIYDIHMYPEILEAVKYDAGLEPIKHIVAKEDYDRWREMQENLAHTKLRVVHDDNLSDQCNKLFVKVMTGGKAKVEHPWNGCFVGDTLITLLDGSVEFIKDLVKLDHVWVKSCNKEGAMRSGKGKARLTKWVSDLIELKFTNDRYVTCTPEHPFMLIDGTYKQAIDLSIKKDRLMSCNGYEILVESKQFIHSYEKIPVYDLEVDKWDNFALMAGVYVHNSKDTADTVANCIWFLESDECEEYEIMTPIGTAALYSDGQMSMFGSAFDDDEEYIDFYA